MNQKYQILGIAELLDIGGDGTVKLSTRNKLTYYDLMIHVNFLFSSDCQMTFDIIWLCSSPSPYFGDSV